MVDPDLCEWNGSHNRYTYVYETLFLKEILNNQVLDVVVAGK